MAEIGTERKMNSFAFGTRKIPPAVLAWHTLTHGLTFSCSAGPISLGIAETQGTHPAQSTA